MLSSGASRCPWQSCRSGAQRRLPARRVCRSRPSRCRARSRRSPTRSTTGDGSWAIGPTPTGTSTVSSSTKGVSRRSIFPAPSSTFANDINNRGEIVGVYWDPDGNQHGYLLAGGVFTTIDAPGATITVPMGVSEQALVSGTYQDADSVAHGFRFDGETLTRSISMGRRGPRCTASTTAAVSSGSEAARRAFSSTVSSWPARGPALSPRSHRDQQPRPDRRPDPRRRLRQHGFLLDHGAYEPIEVPGQRSHNRRASTTPATSSARTSTTRRRLPRVRHAVSASLDVGKELVTGLARLVEFRAAAKPSSRTARGRRRYQDRCENAVPTRGIGWQE